MRIVVREEISEDSELRRSWNGLVLRLQRPEVFYTYEWAIAVQRAYGSSRSPLILLAYDDDSLVGLAALARRTKGEVVFLTADTADYCDFLSGEDIRDEFIAVVFAELRKMDVSKVILTNLPADSPSRQAISRAAAQFLYRIHQRVAYQCARVVFPSSEARAEVKKNLLAKKRLRRNMREMQKIAPVRIQHDTTWPEIELSLQPFMRTHVVRFLEMGKTSSIVHEERRIFLRELAQELSRSGWVALSRFLVGDDTAAWHFGFRFAGSWFWYQPTLNRAFGDFSPGYCLLAKIIEQACDSPDLELVDLGLGAEGYKERFTTGSRETLYCELNRSLPAHIRTVVRHRVAQALTASPAVENRIRGLMAHLASFKVRLRASGLRNSLSWTARRLAHAVVASEDVLFFQWPADARVPLAHGLRLVPLDSDLIGAAAIYYGEDPAALRYLTRCAQRLESENTQGFALLTANDTPVHFCWVRDFEGFDMAELDRRLQAPCPDAVMLFDCYTPVSTRGHGYFSEAIALAAVALRAAGKSPWIFGAAANHSSVRGIQKSAFEYRFTLGRRRIAFFSQRKDSIPEPQPAKRATSVTAA